MNRPNNYPERKSHTDFLIVLSSVFFLVLSSCLTQRNVEYMQGKEGDIQEFNEVDFEDYKLRAKDELYIQISSLDDPSARIFSSVGNQQFVNLGVIQPYGASMISYSVDKEGYILLPVIGKISVQGKTIEEVREELTLTVSKILSQPMVSVKLVNRYVTVLGEVNRPGQYNYFQDKVTIFEAVGLAGDISNWGNRDEVTIIRNENGKIIRLLVNLNDTRLLASDKLYLRPNDIVYVKPLKKKFWGLEQFPYDVLLSAITAGILLYSVVK